MKKLSMNKMELLRWMIAGFLFSMSGVLMQIIAPVIPDRAAVMGIVLFTLMLVFGAAIWKVHNAIHEERAESIREEIQHEREQ